MPYPTIAALDLGSNTFRLMLAEPQSGPCSAERLSGLGDSSVSRPDQASTGAGESWANKKVFQHIPRLSEHLTPGGHFAPEALTRAWEALDDFAGRVRTAGAAKVLAGATMAARLAADGPDFLAAIRERYGWEALILSGEDEARLTASGVLTGLSPRPAHSLIFDIGGRSTEFISAAGAELIKSRSLALGVVALTEEFLSDPVAPSQLEQVAEAVQAVLKAADFSDLAGDFTLVGTAGTVTTLAALLLNLPEYDPDLVNNARLERAAIAGLLASLASQTVAERVKIYGLHPRRADAIVAGLVLVLEIMDFFGRQDMVVSDNGLLEGVWLKAAGLL